MTVATTGNGLTQPTGPINIALNQTTELGPPGAGNNAWTWAVVSNQSAMACKVTTPAGPAQWLQPFSADAYFVGENGPEAITVTPVLATTSSTVGQVLADWYDQAPPGVYPVALISQAVIAAITGSVTSIPPLNGLLYAGQSVNPNSGFLNVANAAAVGMRINNNVTAGAGTTCRVDINWSFDGATTAFAETFYILGNAVMRDVFAVVAPHVQVVLSAGTHAASLTVWATSLGASVEAGSAQVLTQWEAVALAAAGNPGDSRSVFLATGFQILQPGMNLPSFEHIPGDVTVWADIGSANGFLDIEFLDAGNNFEHIFQAKITGGTNVGPFNLTLPRNTCQVILTNLAAAATTGFLSVVTSRRGG